MFDTEITPDLTETLHEDVGLPSDLDRIEPGPFLSVILSGTHRDQLSGHDRVALLKARTRLISHLQAEQLADIQSVSDAVSELANLPDADIQDSFYNTAFEISTALTLTRRASEMQTDLAHRLVERLPQVWQALHAGLIDLPRARVLADQTSHLPEDLARAVCGEALGRAPDQTTGQLRARIQRLIITTDPAAAKDRYEQKLRERKVVCDPTDAGTANLYATDLPAEEANAAMRRINRLARRARRKGDGRGIDEIRADIFLDLLTGRHHDQAKGTARAVVDIRADLTTLLGLDDQPGEIPGWGPVIADVTRKIVKNSEKAAWQFGVTHLDQLVDLITTNRRPTHAQKRLVEVLVPECVWPTCRMSSAECDIDHQIPWQETHQTTISELEPLCRHHHQHAKHGRWKLTRTRPGIYTWTSPLGHTYTKGADPP